MDDEHEVRPRRDAVALLHGRVGGDALLEGRLRLFALAFQRDLDDGREPMAQQGRELVHAEDGHLLFHQPAVHQALDAAQAGGRRDVGTRRQGLVAQAGVLLQGVEQQQVGLIDGD